MILGWLSGCAALADLIPHGPVLGHQARLEQFSGFDVTTVAYEGEPLVPFPVMPVQVFGVTYDLDLVLRSQHPDWDMHEYAKIQTPDGPLWLCKDARATTLEQSIVAQLDDIDWVVPEVPVVRRYSAVQVTDRSTSSWLDLDIAYTNLDGQPVQVHYAGPVPDAPQAKRNTSTMGHSRGAVAAVLDLSHRAFARDATITIAGEPQRLERVLGLVPFRLVLGQTQAGFSVGQLDELLVDGVVTTRHASGATQAWTVVDGGGTLELRQDAPWRTLAYRFRVTPAGATELASVSVRQYAQAADAAYIQFQPPLPDVRRRWSGEVSGAFVVDVNGQPSHGVGRWSAAWRGERVVVSLVPTEPAWFAERPMDVTIGFVGGVAQIEVRRTGE